MKLNQEDILFVNRYLDSQSAEVKRSLFQDEMRRNVDDLTRRVDILTDMVAEIRCLLLPKAGTE